MRKFVELLIETDDSWHSSLMVEVFCSLMSKQHLI